MANGYMTARISEEQTDFAFLLIEAAGLNITIEEWRRFSHYITEWRGSVTLNEEVIVTQDAAGHVKGLCVLQMNENRLFGRVLDVPVFIGVSAADEDGVVGELLEAVKKFAETEGCREIRVWTPGGRTWTRALGSSPGITHYRGAHIRLG